MRARNRGTRRWFILATCCFALVLGVVMVNAQAPTPINIGENQTAQIVDAQLPVRFTLSAASPLSVQLQVLAISPGLAPTFRVLDPGGVVILTAANSGTQTIVQGTPNLASPGAYTIEVSSANGATGQFLISAQAGAPLAPPQPLASGQPLNATLNALNARQAFSFAGSNSDIMLLLVRSSTPNGGPVVTLRDADTGDTLALNSARLAGVIYRIGTGSGNYLVEVTHSGTTPSEGYVICLAPESAATGCPGISAQAVVPATPIPTIFVLPTATPLPIIAASPTFSPVVINPAGACQVASARGATINIRSAPGTGFSVVGQLPPNAALPVIGRLPDNSWFQVNRNGTLGWVSATVVIIGGNCAGVSVVNFPTATPSVIPPLSTIEVSPLTATATATATNPPPVVTLNYNLSPVFGSAELTSNFGPDPFTVGITSGGPASVSYLGDGCLGYTTSAPSFSLSYTSGDFSLLRFYFIGSSDTTMVINSPNGSYFCVDDSFDTVDPTIDFNNPVSGRYDIWIASYLQGASISGFLYITENANNHPS